MRRNFSRVLTLGDSLATITLTLTLTPAFCRVKVRPHKNLLFKKSKSKFFSKSKLHPALPANLDQEVEPFIRK